MKATPRFIGDVLRLLALFVTTATSAFAGATIMQQIDPPEVSLGDQVVVTLTVHGGTVGDLQLPQVDGLRVTGTNSTTNITFSNGTLSRSLSLAFRMVPSRMGDLVIPAFDVQTQEGDIVHVKAMKIHVLGNTPAPSTNNAPVPDTSQTAPSGAMTAPATPNPNGPVVMPPPAAPAPPTQPNFTTTVDEGNSSVNPPMDPDGTAAKVFLIITPQTTDAYVGQAVPLRIDFYIRMDVNADQNSLPTIKGSDFLMNSFTTRGRIGTGMISSQQYMRESWLTAISAPKSGDFPLVMERDTYWIKSITQNHYDPFGGFFGRHANLAHESISSNGLTMHVHALPTEGQPDHFTGAIGQFQVTGEARPTSVAVGEPLALYFSIAGEGNFDYVRCPVVPDDPAWKSYVPSSRVEYRDEPHTHAVKTFEQSIIPNKNGTVPLPTASFSYFDPVDKKYVTVPIALGAINVTGTALPVAAAPSGTDSESTSAAFVPKPLDFLPNRTDIGSPHPSLTPVFRQTWFWVAQGGLISLPVLGAVLLFFRSRREPADDRTERELRQRFRQQEEDAMTAAVSQGDAVAFFLAARHAVQLQLGAQWNVKPEALTLGEIRSRDPELAERVAPLFQQADVVIYSGRAASNLDLVEWNRRVREFLQLQTA